MSIGFLSFLRVPLPLNIPSPGFSPSRFLLCLLLATCNQSHDCPLSSTIASTYSFSHPPYPLSPYPPPPSPPSPTNLDGVGPSFVSSAARAGFNYPSDFNDPEGQQGAGYYHFNIKGESDCTY